MTIDTFPGELRTSSSRRSWLVGVLF